MSFDLTIAGAEMDTETPWSQYQTSIFSFAEKELSSAIIEAVAGSGKTKTMVELANRLMIWQDCSILVVAFNKAIQQTFAAKLPGDVSAYTFHALGLNVLRRRLRKARVFGGKSYNILKAFVPKEFYEDNKRDLSRLVSLAKGTGLYPTEMCMEHFLSLIDDYGLDIRERDITRAVEYAHEALIKSEEDITSIDFDDMLWLPIIWGMEFPQYDFVLVDEAQDLSSIQQEMLARTKPKRIFAFGDSRQAIYGFRGADSSSMTNLANRFKCEKLPLSVTYRCPTAVVDEAKAIVPNIEPRPDAPIGTVQDTDRLDFRTLTPADMVVCRNNKPLFSLGMRLIREKIPCKVLGNFRESLAFFIKNFNTEDIEVLKHRLRRWLDEEVQAAEDREAYGKAAALEDKYGCVLALTEGASNVKDMLQNLDALTAGAGVTLCSIHKSKGLEAETVVFYMPQLIPATYAKSKSQLEQESNLRYVAITRAKDTLIYLED